MAAIATAAVTGLVKASFQGIGRALSKAAKEQVLNTYLMTNLTEPNQLFGPPQHCLQVVRGRFRFTDTEGLENSLLLPEQGLEGARVQALEEELFIELLPLRRDDLVTFVPLVVHYEGNRPHDGWRTKGRDLALVIGLAGADQALTEGHYPGRLLPLGTFDLRNGPVTRRFVDDTGRLLPILQTQWQPMPDDQRPSTLSLLLTETKKPHAFMGFLSDLFTESRSDLQSAVTDSLTRSDLFKEAEELRQQRLAKEEAALARRLAYFEARQQALEREAELERLCKDPKAQRQAIFQAQLALYQARSAANLKAEAAGLEIPYTGDALPFPDGHCPGEGP